MPNRFSSYDSSFKTTVAISQNTKSPLARPARVRKVNLEQGYILVDFFDDVKGSFLSTKQLTKITQKIPMPQPFVGLGWGIYVGITEGSECFVSVDRGGRFYVSSWKMNPFYLNTDFMKSIAAEKGFPFDEDGSPSYEVFRKFSSGDLLFISRGGSGVISKASGSTELFDKNGQRIFMSPPDNKTFYRLLNIYETSESGIYQQGMVYRNRTNEKSLTESTPVTVAKATTVGVVDRIPITAADYPGAQNPGYTEVYRRIVETADNTIGLTNITPVIHTREGTVIGDKDIEGEDSLNGKVLKMGSEPDSDPVHAGVLTNIAMWFRKVFKTAISHWEFRISKLGKMQLYVKQALGDTSKNDVSFESKTGAIIIKLREPIAPNLNSVHVEDDGGNKVKFTSTGMVYEDRNGNKIEMTASGVNINAATSNQNSARNNDPTLSNATTDATYWAWLTGFMAIFSAWVPVPGDGGALLKTLVTAYLLANPVPASLTGKINGGSSTVKVGG